MNMERKDQVTLTVNVKGLETVAFNLTYEEYLPKKGNAYRQTIRIQTDVVVNVTGQVFLDVLRNGTQKIGNIYMVDAFLKG
jgi:hypothetical protein